MATKKKTKPTKLTEDLRLKIRNALLEGLNQRETRESLDIKDSTWDMWKWKDYEGFRKLLRDTEQEIMLNTAKEFSKELMKISHIDARPEGPDIINDRILRIKHKESEFIRETLGKDEGYTKRAESTGKDGAPLIPVDQKTKEEADAVLLDYINNNKGKE